MKTSELVEFLKTHEVTEAQLYNLLASDLELAAPSIDESNTQAVIRFFMYQIQAVVFPVIRDLHTLSNQVKRGGQIFKDELDKQDG